eukprot:340650_1
MQKQYKSHEGNHHNIQHSMAQEKTNLNVSYIYSEGNGEHDMQKQYKSHEGNHHNIQHSMAQEKTNLNVSYIYSEGNGEHDMQKQYKSHEGNHHNIQINDSSIRPPPHLLLFNNNFNNNKCKKTNNPYAHSNGYLTKQLNIQTDYGTNVQTIIDALYNMEIHQLNRCGDLLLYES